MSLNTAESSRIPVILVVGQTPPPHHGQARMIEAMVQGEYCGFRLVHVRMAFSDRMDQISRFHPGKVIHLFGLIALVIIQRIRTGAAVLYYPPAGAHRVPMWRDIVFLIATRWMFRRTVFHFHAGGLSTLYPDLPAWGRFLFRMAYFNPDLAIRISRHTPADGLALAARQEAIIANGIPDDCGSMPDRRNRGPVVKLLYVGMLAEAKGVSVLIEACRMLIREKLSFHLTLVGEFADLDYRQHIHQELSDPELKSHVTLAGFLSGKAKSDAYRAADIFVFPSFFPPAETFGLVAVEAMSFGLPVVAANWSGIPDVVADGQTGRLVTPRDAGALARALRELIGQQAQRELWGQNGRQRFLDEFTLKVHRERLGECLRSLAINALEKKP